MRFTVVPGRRDHVLFWYWILRDGVEVLTKEEGYADKRAATEGARNFKRRVAAAEIDCEERPWHREVIHRAP